jgi:hypothetical protein
MSSKLEIIIGMQSIIISSLIIVLVVVVLAVQAEQTPQIRFTKLFEEVLLYSGSSGDGEYE